MTIQEKTNLQIINKAKNVAQRDVIILPADKKSEAQLQAEFFQSTGIWCSRLERIELEYLINECDFSVQKVYRVRQAGFLKWDKDLNRLNINYSKFFNYFMFLIFVLVSLIFSWAATEIMDTYKIHKWPDNLIILLSLITYGLLIYPLARYGIEPTRHIDDLAVALKKRYS
ncbi:hypothetical protein J3998_11930 [Thiomicrorhabdus sp. 6S2-11]|uniref:Uncharacterized protein n=1 Tax=Thiomicrorhabdus marina TaxID=2818442 RepID=A0ABS3Q7N8_9GAMM|nr:hypothetical protein [Thiomicrorhabdus marina]MBO1928282.1 hypothetical protein [Thiomicrorhabdus marina]